MKKILAIITLSLYLITPSQANDIRDFQIQGISIGDSLLDFYKEKQILNFQKANYDRKDFYLVFTKKDSGEYEQLGFNLKNDDKKYIIHGIKGTIFFKDKFKKCLEWKKNAIKDINLAIPGAKFSKELVTKYDVKSMKNSEAYTNHYFFPSSNGAMRIWCTKLSKDIKMDDRGSISFASKELVGFLSTR
jgi:hypothetical protein